MKLHWYPNPPALGAGIAEEFRRAAMQAAEERGAFHVALSGGSTPRLMYRELRDLSVPWQAVRVYFSDERTVPPDSPDSNYRLAHDELLSQVPIPADQVFRLQGELDPSRAAREYEALLPDRLDLVLLGMGDDGHTASLFPDTEALRAPGRVAANRVEKLGTWRLTFTFDEINAARERWIMATGANKADVLRDVERRAGIHPVERVQDPVWFVDEAAASQLKG